jgi:hypothetical protein
VIEHKSEFSAVDLFRDGPLPRRDGDQVAGHQAQQLGARLCVSWVKLTGHEQIAGSLALWSSAKLSIVEPNDA